MGSKSRGVVECFRRPAFSFLEKLGSSTVDPSCASPPFSFRSSQLSISLRGHDVSRRPANFMGTVDEDEGRSTRVGARKTEAVAIETEL